MRVRLRLGEEQEQTKAGQGYWYHKSVQQGAEVGKERKPWQCKRRDEKSGGRQRVGGN